jgi:hypothetical protein
MSVAGVSPRQGPRNRSSGFRARSDDSPARAPASYSRHEDSGNNFARLSSGHVRITPTRVISRHLALGLIFWKLAEKRRFSHKAVSLREEDHTRISAVFHLGFRKLSSGF